MHASSLPLLFRLLIALGVVQVICTGLAWALHPCSVRLRWWAALAGWCLPLAVLAPWWLGGRLLAPTPAGLPIHPNPPGPHATLSDATYQFLPWELEIRDSLGEFQLPLWSDRLDGGSSPWLNPVAQVLSPVAMIARIAPLPQFLLVALALKLLVAVEGTILLARKLSASSLPSLIAGVAYGLGGGIMAWSLFPHTSAAAWIPWVALSLVCLARGNPAARVRAFMASCGCVALLLFSGHPEVALAGLLFAIGLALWFHRRRRFWTGAAWVGAATTIGVALTATQLVPFALAAQDSERRADQETRPHVAVTMGPSPRTWFAPGSDTYFLAPLGPEVFGKAYQEPLRGPWDWPDALSGYAGITALLGVVAAMAPRARRKAVPLVVFVGATLIAAAEFVPFDRLSVLWPALRMPAYARGLLVASLALAIAGALGLDQLRRLRSDRALLIGTLAVCAVALLADHSLMAVALWIAALSGAALTVWRRPVGLAVLVAVTVCDLAVWSNRLLPVGEPGDFFPPSHLIERLRQLDGNPLTGRAVGEDLLAYPGVLPSYGIAEVRPNNPLAPRRYIALLDWAFGFHPDLFKYYAPFGNLRHPLLDFLGVRVVVSNAYLDHPPGFLTERDPRDAPYELLLNPRALPRVFFPRGVVEVSSNRLEAWVRQLRDGAVVATAPGSRLPATPFPSSGEAPRAHSSRSGEIVVTFPPEASPRLLATSILSAGWRASSEGQPLEIRDINSCFLGVIVPGGRANVTLRYLPPGFIAGTALSGLAVISLLLVAVCRRAD